MAQISNAIYQALTGQQRLWAVQRGLALDSKWHDYVTRCEDNLFQPLSPETNKEYEEGAGVELKPQADGKPPKLFALHSSTALVCNLFDYWRHRDVPVIASPCGAASDCNV